MFDGNVLLQQLADLGRQLEAAVDDLGDLDMHATGLGCDHRRLEEEHEDALAEAYLKASGSNQEARRAEARLKCVPSRLTAQDAARDWEQAKSRVRTKQAAIRMLTTRIEIGRSLLSHEKTMRQLDVSP